MAILFCFALPCLALPCPALYCTWLEFIHPGVVHEHWWITTQHSMTDRTEWDHQTLWWTLHNTLTFTYLFFCHWSLILHEIKHQLHFCSNVTSSFPILSSSSSTQSITMHSIISLSLSAFPLILRQLINYFTPIFPTSERWESFFSAYMFWSFFTLEGLGSIKNGYWWLLWIDWSKEIQAR